MCQAPQTRPSILIRIQDRSDQQAWRTFESLYRPVIYRAARLSGLQDADAHDVAQVVLTKLSRGSWKFQPSKDRGRFRTWLAKVTHNAIVDHHRSRHDQPISAADMERSANQGTAIKDHLDHEYRREIFHWAANLIRKEFSPEAWAAFWRTSVEGESIASVAERMDRSIGSIYTSRSRIMCRLREQVGLFDNRLEEEL